MSKINYKIRFYKIDVPNHNFICNNNNLIINKIKLSKIKVNTYIMFLKCNLIKYHNTIMIKIITIL